jgi:hypothetical protein
MAVITDLRAASSAGGRGDFAVAVVKLHEAAEETRLIAQTTSADPAQPVLWNDAARTLDRAGTAFESGNISFSAQLIREATQSVLDASAASDSSTIPPCSGS